MRHTDGYTGHLFEEEVLGRCKVYHCGYMQWRDAVEQVRRNQPRKKTETVECLEKATGYLLKGEVRFYTAVGTPLDFFHGVDGFAEFRGEIVTIDLTMNPHKESSKSDLVYSKGDPLEELPGRIARLLESKLTRRAA